MAKRSKVVTTYSEDIHKSRLIKSVQLVENLDDYTEKPTGVWGSTAVIKSGGVTIKSVDLDVEFDIPFDDNLEANEGEIIVYNLSDNTIKQLKKDAKITIEAGYENDTGIIFEGYIVKVLTERDDADKVTTIKVKDDIQKKESLNLTYASGSTAQYILKDLINKTGLPIGKLNFARDWTYDNDVTVDEDIESAIRKYSEVCGVSTFVVKGKIYSCSLKNFDTVEFNVSEETGMIGSPMPYTEESTAEDYTDVVEGFEIDMLLQHRMSAGSVINLDSEQYKGKYRVKSGNHTFNISECVTKIKVV